MVEPAGDQSHAARPNITPRQELANLRAKVCETRARLTKKTRDSTHKARSSVGRDSAGDEVCLAGAPRRLVLCAPARLCKKCRQTPYSNRTTFPPTFPHHF